MCLLANPAWNCYVTSSLCSLEQGLYHFVGPSFPTYKMMDYTRCPQRANLQCPNRFGEEGAGQHLPEKERRQAPRSEDALAP